MTHVLHASRATRAALGYRVHHGPGGFVHYSTASAATSAAVAPDSSRSFCLSTEKLSLQQLNRRLASYLQQVQCLEAANQRLELQIQEVLDRKCPRELRELDGHLRTVSLLQDQIGECLSAQAQVKLQLLGAELTVFNLSGRCEKQRERRGCVEAELSDLRLLEEELQVHRLPELQRLLNDRTQQLMELQIKHQQFMQGLQAQVSGGVAVEMQTAESLNLIQQLDNLRQTSVTLLEENQNKSWFNTQVSLLGSPEVTFDPPAGSEVVQAELQELRRTAASLEEELTQLQAVNLVLEASGQDRTESFVLQLVVLQQRADGLCRDLDSVLQATAQQAADHQALLDVKTRLETEIQDYRRLLDGLRPQGVSSLHSNSAVNVTSFHDTTRPSAFRRNITVDKTINIQGGNLSRGHIRTVRQTPIIAPLSETVTTVQSIRVHSKHPKNSSVTSINTSNLTGSFHRSVNLRTGVPPERTGRESMTLSTPINRQSSSVEDKVHVEDRDLKNSLMVRTQISQGLDEGDVVKVSKPEINTKQISTEAGLQANKTGTTIQTEITKTIICAEPEVNQGPHMTTSDPSQQIAAEVKTQTETVNSAQINCTEGSIQAKNQDPANVCLSLETPAEAVRDAREVAITASIVSGSHILKSEDAQGKASGELTLMDDKDKERQEEKEEKEEVVELEGTSLVLRLDPNLLLSLAFNSGRNKVMDDGDTESDIAIASPGSPDSNDNLEDKTLQGITTLVQITQSARGAAVQAKTETFTLKQTPTEAGLQACKTGTNIQTEITKAIFCAEPEVTQGLCFVTHTTTTDPSKQTAAEVKKETEAVPSAQVNCTEDSIQAKYQDPAKVVSSSLETPAEAVGDVGEVTASIVSGSHILGSEAEQAEVSGELTLMDDNDKERQDTKGEQQELEEVEGTLLVLRLDQSSKLFVASNSEQKKLMEDADTEYDIAIASSTSPDSNDDLESKTSEILKKVGLEVNKEKVVNGFHDTIKVKVEPTELDNEIVNLEGQEALLNTTESKQSASLTDSGVGLSSSSLEEILREAHVFLSPTKPSACLSPEICLSPVETEVLMRMTDQVFYPVNPDEHFSPVSLLSPKESDTCLRPVEAKVCLCPNGEEEDEEACLSLTEANALVRPVEKYTLSTKEEGQSLSFSGDQTLPEEDRNRKVSISVRDGESLCFGSFEGNEEGRGILNCTNINSKPASQEIGHQLSSSLGGSEFGSLGGRSIIADKEEQLGFGSLYRTSVRDAKSPGDRYKDTGGSSDNKDLAASFGATAKNSLGTVSRNADAANTGGVKGRFGHGSGEWMIYGGSLVHLSKSLPITGSKESPSGATLPATSRAETGRLNSRGSGEWMVYGSSLGRKHSLDGGISLPSEGKEEGPSVTSPQETGRFSSRGSGEWMVYGGSLGRKSSLPSTRREESPPIATHLATNKETRRFGSGGSGEWRVYGGSTGRLSSAISTDRVSVSANHSQIISPSSSYTSSRPRLSSAGSGGQLSSGGVVRRSRSVGSGGRLSSSGSGGRLSGSGERKPVYSSASGRKSSVGSAGRSGGGGTTSSQRAPSPRGRMGASMGSGGWLSSSTAGGSRISSPGSASKLSSAGSSDRISSRTGGRISSSSGSGRTNSTGGRVISSSDRPVRSTGSGTGGNKERISVCKMAALSISAAGRERSQDRQRQAQAATSPLVQRWLTTGVGVTGADPDGLDDIMRL